MDEQASGDWKRFASGKVENGKGRTVTLRLDSSGISARWVRVLMSESSNTCDTHGTGDKRNCVGYAIKEVYLGTVDGKGGFKDLLRHSNDQKQSATYCSSVDPRHEPSDLLVAPDQMASGDQPGLTCFIPAALREGCPRSFLVPCCMARRRIPRRKLLI